MTILLQGDEWGNRLFASLILWGGLLIYVCKHCEWMLFQILDAIVYSIHLTLIVGLWVFQRGKISDPCISSQSQFFPWHRVQHQKVCNPCISLSHRQSASWNDLTCNTAGWVWIDLNIHIKRDGGGQRIKTGLFVASWKSRWSICVAACSQVKNVS